MKKRLIKESKRPKTKNFFFGFLIFIIISLPYMSFFVFFVSKL